MWIKQRTWSALPCRKKINFLHYLLKIRLFLNALSRLYRAAGCCGLSVRRFTLVGDNTATGFWLSVGGIGGLAVYIVLGNGTKQWRSGSVNITRWWQTFSRCGNVAVVALCLLVNRKMCFYGVWHTGSLKGLKPEIVWWPDNLIQNPWTRELTSNPPECFPSVCEIAVVYPTSHQRSEKQYLTIPVKYTLWIIC